MAGFPKEGKLIEIGHEPEQLAGPVSLSSCLVQQRGPGPQQVQRRMQQLSGKPERPGGNLHATCAWSIEAKRKIATRRPGLAKDLWFPAPILMRGSPERRTPRLYSN
jgi:hypothetical protein